MVSIQTSFIWRLFNYIYHWSLRVFTSAIYICHEFKYFLDTAPIISLRELPRGKNRMPPKISPKEEECQFL